MKYYDELQPRFGNEISAARARNQLMTQGWECEPIVKLEAQNGTVAWFFDARRIKKPKNVKQSL